MHDVTALMSKLKANVAYLQFDDPMTEARSHRPPVARVAEQTAADPAAIERPAPPAPRLALALSRYAPAGETRALADIFARLERAGQ
jgi:hypothetical protein